VKTRFYYPCDKTRNYTSKATIRKTATRATGCPFQVLIYQLSDTEAELQWRLEVENGYHNHIPFIKLTAHHVYRKETQAQKEIIESI
jgi:hypothetical protein